MGFKGRTVLDSGYFYCPYIDLDGSGSGAFPLPLPDPVEQPIVSINEIADCYDSTCDRLGIPTDKKHRSQTISEGYDFLKEQWESMDLEFANGESCWSAKELVVAKQGFKDYLFRMISKFLKLRKESM